ncbi:MAG TPA: hypothetical protein PKE29_07825, partial [Phycisphaerales bacterium]|nr:hypothetical protein [Phycisphaerales bacterium]
MREQFRQLRAQAVADEQQGFPRHQGFGVSDHRLVVGHPVLQRGVHGAQAARKRRTLAAPVEGPDVKALAREPGGKVLVVALVHADGVADDHLRARRARALMALDGDGRAAAAEGDLLLHAMKIKRARKSPPRPAPC